MTTSRRSTIATCVAVAGMVAAAGCRGGALNGSKQGEDGGGQAGTTGDGGVISRGDARADASGPGAPPVVDPAISRAWTWSACGTLAPAPADLQAAFGADGKIAVRSERGVRVYDAGGTLQPESDGPADLLVVSDGGEILVGRVTPAAIALGAIGAPTARFTFTFPEGVGCQKATAITWRGAYLLARSADTACVWSTSDRAFLGALPISGGEAALRGDRLVSLQGGLRSTQVITRDLTGRELGRISVGDAIFASLSPGGDRLLTWDPPALWDLDSGTALPWSADPGEPSEHAIFSTAGDLVLLGGGVFQTGDGSLVHRIDPTSRASRFVHQALALAPEGSGTVLSEFGRATLETPPAPGLVAVLGGPPPPREGSLSSAINHLALSQDGSLLIANVLGSWAFSLRLAPDFAGSRIASTFFTEINADVDVSADGALAAIAGDGLALFGAADGQIIWQPPPPPPEVAACSLEKLRLSPKKTWAAGASYFQRIEIFALADSRGQEAPPPLLQLPSGCGDIGVFSRDERLMATSTPAVYRTAATSAGWQKVWSAPDPPKASGFDPNGAGFSNDVRFSPDESQLLVSQCSARDTCSSRLLDVGTGAVLRELPQVTGPHPSFSPDGSWIVAAGVLVHLPSGDTQTLSPVGAPGPTGAAPAKIMTALFTPGGDIIAGSSDGSLTRYCRSP